MRFQVLVGCALVKGSTAFFPASLTVQKNTQRNRAFARRRDSVSLQDQLLTDPKEPAENSYSSEYHQDEGPIFPVVSPDPSLRDASVDEGAEIFLNSILQTKPQDILAEADEALDSIFAEANGTIDEAPSFVLDTVGESNNTFGAVDSVMNDDLKVVLEASSAAAAAAEASMSPDLRKQLDIPSNSTQGEYTAPTERVSEILSASSVVGERVTSKIEAPEVSKILKFAIPAIGVWLCGPLLSLIDTSAVGVLSGTIQQAALNPAVAVTDYAALLIAFMYTGTTNLVAAARESDRSTADKPATTKTVIGAMQMSTYVGAGLGLILFAFARPLLRAIIGNDGISPAVFDAAMKYVRIRALGMPAAAIIGSTQAACLGMQDIRSPLYVLAAAAAVNFLGDVIFVGSSNPWIGGAAGAAWATVFSQYAGVAFFVRWLCHKSAKKAAKPHVINLSDAILEITGKPSSKGKGRRKQFRKALETFTLAAKDKKKRGQDIVNKILRRKTSPVATVKAPAEDSFSVRGFLADRFSGIDLLKPPSKESRDEFAPYLLPVTSTQVGRVSGYVAMSHVVASSLGTVSMAAQQVIVSLFYCLCPIADSLSLTAQSFIPAISERKPSREKAAALKRTALNFAKAGAIFGGVMVAAVGAIPILSGFFTSDPVVKSLVNSVVPLLVGFFAVHGILCGSEGLLLGQKDLSFLGNMYAGYFLAVPYFMLRVKRAALSGSHPVSITSVWKVFVGYQMFRFVAWLARVAMLQKRAENAVNKAEESLSPVESPAVSLAP